MTYKIVYFAIVSNNLGGVEQKIIAQFDALYKLKAEINLFLVSSFTPNESLAFEIKKRPNVKILINSPSKLWNPWERRKEKFDIITSTLAQYDPKNILVYFRYPLADFLFLRFLIKNKEYRFITEHQEIENRLRIGILRFNWTLDILDIIFGKAVRKRIIGFVSVTTEISTFERSLVKDNSHYFETIGNGIDLIRYPLRIQKIDSQYNEIRILFIGSGFRPHGLDRLIRSIYEYYKNRKSNYEIYLKVAGYSAEMHINMKLVKNLKLTSKVSFLGNLEREQLDELFNWANIGVGSLAIHRKGLKFTSELKAREYCARGLPFFGSSRDDDIPENHPYVLNLKAEDSPFDISEIIKFVEKTKLDEDHPKKMRQFAIDHLDWSTKMKKLIIFFDKIMQKKIRYL